ncbi:MAG: lolE [Verrucomicrobiales bacterium]|nr:lolE [Verrucomicrobiales bacterium]
MKFSWFIALRYLKPRGTFVSVITLISVAGVALGVGVLLVVIAVMSGFEKKIKEEFLKAEPALIVRDLSQEGGLSGGQGGENPDGNTMDWRAVQAVLRQVPEVTAVSPLITTTAVLEKKPTPEEEEMLHALNRAPREAQTLLVGLDTQDTVQMERLQRLMDQNGKGNFELAGPSIILSHSLVNRLRDGFDMTYGESAVNAYGTEFLRGYRNYYQEQQRAKGDPEKLKAVEDKDRDLPLPEELIVQGSLEDSKLQGSISGYISLKTAQKLAGSGKGIEGFSVEIRDPYRAGEVKLMMLKALTKHGMNEAWLPVTWMESHRTYFDAIANERGMMYLVLAFISIVAAFCIMNTMITMAVQKRKEIGMMRALGAKVSQIISLFAVKGLVVATIGVGSGYVLGSLVLHYRNTLRDWIGRTFDWQIFDERIYGLSQIPADPRLVDNLMICGIAFVLCTLAAVPPAFLVGRMDPARALRSER